MGNLFVPGGLFSISRDIVVGGKIAFHQGEQVTIESITPNPQRPDSKYVVMSTTLNQRFQLKAEDMLLAVETAQDSPLQSTCATCGTSFDPTYKFCPSCGANTETTAQAPAAAPPQVAAPAQIVQPPEPVAVSSEGFPPSVMSTV